MFTGHRFDKKKRLGITDMQILELCENDTIILIQQMLSH